MSKIKVGNGIFSSTVHATGQESQELIIIFNSQSLAQVGQNKVSTVAISFIAQPIFPSAAIYAHRPNQ